DGDVGAAAVEVDVGAASAGQALRDGTVCVHESPHDDGAGGVGRLGVATGVDTGRDLDDLRAFDENIAGGEVADRAVEAEHGAAPDQLPPAGHHFHLHRLALREELGQLHRLRRTGADDETAP